MTYTVSVKLMDSPVSLGTFYMCSEQCREQWVHNFRTNPGCLAPWSHGIVIRGECEDDPGAQCDVCLKRTEG